MSEPTWGQAIDAVGGYVKQALADIERFEAELHSEVWFDILDDDTPSIKRVVRRIPCKGESVGIIPCFPEMAVPKEFKLHYVVDVRHYWDEHGQQEIHVMLSERP
jgi:hypothetical protein